ncbi:unnamed protein product, partial [Protopolystoma xenopodis]
MPALCSPLVSLNQPNRRFLVDAPCGGRPGNGLVTADQLDESPPVGPERA